MTEHAAGIFVFFFLGEYASIILICILITLILLGGYDILTMIFFLEKLFYTLIYFFFSSIYAIYLNLSFIILGVLNGSETIITSNASNLFYTISNIKENFQFNLYIDIINYIYYNYMKLNMEYGLYNILGIFSYFDKLNIIVDTLKIIPNSPIFLSLMYALGLSIKTIILIFSFI
jgi:hypothetical protein